VSYLLPVLNKSLAEIYLSKSDDELIALAADADALVDEARPILADELLRRNIMVTKTSASERSIPQKDSQVFKVLRFLGAFVLNLAIATFGTSVVESPLWSAWSRIGRAHSVSGIEEREWLLSLTIAVLLGIFIGSRWSRAAVWVWTLPISFFVLGALLHSTRPRPSVLVGGGFAEHFFFPNCLADPHECRDFFFFTLPAARTAVYSLGTWVSSHFQRPTP
jgi:hypothetical protein